MLLIFSSKVVYFEIRRLVRVSLLLFAFVLVLLSVALAFLLLASNFGGFVILHVSQV